MNERDVLLSLIASLTLCDHMGDVSNAVDTALRLIGVNADWDTWDDLQAILYQLGITTLHGTVIGED